MDLSFLCFLPGPPLPFLLPHQAEEDWQLDIPPRVCSLLSLCSQELRDTETPTLRLWGEPHLHAAQPWTCRGHGGLRGERP